MLVPTRSASSRRGRTWADASERAAEPSGSSPRSCRRTGQLGSTFRARRHGLRGESAMRLSPKGRLSGANGVGDPGRQVRLAVVLDGDRSAAAIEVVEVAGPDRGVVSEGEEETAAIVADETK